MHRISLKVVTRYHHWVFYFYTFFICKDDFKGFVLFLNLFSLTMVLTSFPHKSLQISNASGTTFPSDTV